MVYFPYIIYSYLKLPEGTTGILHYRLQRCDSGILGMLQSEMAMGQNWVHQSLDTKKRRTKICGTPGLEI